MTSVEFDNNSAVIKAVSGIASFSKIAHNTANMTDFWKHTWVEADKATAIVSDIRKNGLDLAANMVRGGNTVNKISILICDLISSLILICSLQHIPKSNISKTTKKTAMWNSLFLTVIGEETILIFRRRM